MGTIPNRDEDRGKEGRSRGATMSNRSPADRTEDAPPSIDETLELLADRERRRVLEHLVEKSTDSASIAELREQLGDGPTGEPGCGSGLDRFELSLHHIHLPMMDAAGIVEYDARSKDLRYRPDDRLETWLERVRAEEPE